jgi:hypothetical protein
MKEGKEYPCNKGVGQTNGFGGGKTANTKLTDILPKSCRKEASGKVERKQ